jgi:ribonuclease D
MLNYASMDSHYLIALRNFLNQELIEKSLMSLAQEDFNRICDLDPFPAHKNGEQCWKMIKGNHLSPQQMAVLMELCNFRETIAEHANIPAFKVLDSELLIWVARTCPATPAELSEVKGMTAKLLGRYGNDLLKCVQVGLANEPIYRQPRAKPNDDTINRYETIKLWRKNKAVRLGVESDVILPKDKIELIAQKNPKTIEELAHLMEDIPYRYASFGNELLEILLKSEG